MTTTMPESHNIKSAVKWISSELQEESHLALNDLIQQMTQNQQVDDELERQAHEFLKQGPPLVKAKSRFTATVSYETET